MESQRKVLWIVLGGAACLGVLVLFAMPFFRQEGNSTVSSMRAGPPGPLPSVSPAPGRDEGREIVPDSRPDLAAAPHLPDRDKGRLPALPTPNQAMIEFHQKAAAGFQARLRQDTQHLYGGLFQQLGLSPDVEAKVLDILTQPQRQLEEQAFEAAQKGTIPAPMSPEQMRAQMAQQNQQLRSVLGEDGFAAFDQYRATLPDRIIIDALNQQGANLTDGQSQQLLQVLTQARQEVIGQSPVTRNLDSMPPDQAATAIQQQQALLLQTVSNRSQSILTPQQQTALQGIMSRLSVPPKTR
ncbi:MAG: hypothetical protein JOY92_04310 [Verrucomicrobia bacterium]|nr:hypothetical protein [Verrucomicrobiota bacterium]